MKAAAPSAQTTADHGQSQASRPILLALLLLALPPLLPLSGCTTSQMALQEGLTGSDPATPVGSPAQSSSQSKDPGSGLHPDPDAAPDAAMDPSEPLWTRLQRSFALPPSDHPEVAKQRALLLKHPEHLRRTQEQAAPYIGYVLDQVERRNMPGELALVPMIESGYRPQALSPEQAAGLWQFIPATGRAFGLPSNRWYEGRRDIAASTDAALDYLSRIHADFDHDWALTLAAYNIGEPAIKRAIKKNRKRGKPTDFWSLELPKETRSYVPKLLALRDIFANPERYGVVLRPISANKPLQLVELDAPTDLGLVARLAEIGMNKLRRLNPGFSSWFTGHSGPHRLLLPAEKVEQFNQRLAQVPLTERLRMKEHRVVKGDTLAKLARRYHCDPALIKSTNNLKSNRLKPASTLLIPTPYPDPTPLNLSADTGTSPGITAEPAQPQLVARQADKTPPQAPLAPL
jgi:membrane-bound lytic murein transglycosylase D